MQEYVPPTPPAFDDDKVRRTLENLIDACLDGEAGFRNAAQHVKDPQLRQYFADRGRERARFSVELRRELERDGHWQCTREGSVTGALYRTWFDIKRAVGGGDQAVLDSVEAGEDAARDAYQNALKQPLPPQAMALIRSQAQSIMASHDHVRTLRDRRKAA